MGPSAGTQGRWGAVGTAIRSLPHRAQRYMHPGVAAWLGPGPGERGRERQVGLPTSQLVLLSFPARPGPTQETGARKSGRQ